MIKKYTIDKIYKKSIDTKNGKAMLYDIYFEENQKQKVSTFEGQWNDHYDKGTVVEFVLEEDKDSNKDLPYLVEKPWGDVTKGGTNYNLYAPDSARFTGGGGGGAGGGVSKEEFNALKDRVTTLEGGEFDEGLPPVEKEVEIDTKDIPFP